MTHFRRGAMLAIAVVMLSASMAAAGDWPQWLGPTRQAVSDETIKPWKEKPEPAWSVPVGEGHSSPVVADGRLFLHTRVKDEDAELVQCLDAKTGKQLWEKSYERSPFSTPFGNGPRATPTVAGDKVYTLGSTGILSCFGVEDGKLHWRVDVLKKFGAENLVFGVSTSPLVYHGKVMVMVGAKGASIVAFDAENGDVKWKTGDDPASYASPIIWHADMPNYAVFLTGAHLLALNPEDGKILWQVPFKDLLNESSTTPVRIGGNVLASSVTAGSIVAKFDAKDPEIVWKTPTLTCYFSTPIVVGNPESHLYMVTGRLLPPPKASLHCVDPKNGKIVWSKEGVGKYHASLMRLKDGKVLMMEDDGDLVLLESNIKEYEELARSKVCGETWAHPALAHGKLYIRDNEKLMCFPMGE